MKKRRVWIALGMTVVLCTASAAGAVVMDNSKVAVSSAESEASDVEESETVLTEAVESEAPETEAEAESEAESESETEIESETEEEEDVEKYTAVSYEDEDPWSQVAITNSEYVESGVVIRSEPNLDSEVLGYLYKGTAVWVIERGETWTEFYSNGMTGYVMTHYLLFGADVQEIAEVYGAEGVRAEWDDVNIYTSDDAATVLDTMDAGDVYQVVNDYGHWIEIQYDEDTTAYVSSEDVTSVMLFESATPKDGERVELVKLYGVTYAGDTDTYSEDEETYTESSSSDSSSGSSSSSGGSSSGSSSSSGSASSSSPSSGSSSSSSSSSSGSSSSGSSSSSSSSSSGSSSSSSSSSSGSSSSSSSSSSGSSSSSSSSSSGSSSSSSSSSSTAQTEAPQTETTASAETEQTETSGSNSSSGSSSEGGYYDADTDTYYDEDGNAISTASYASETTYTEETVYTEAETSAYVETESETAYTYTETEAETAYTYTETEAETTYTYTETEATTSSQTGSTSSDTTASTDDTTLLAALIYCEAGNQSYEGMVAVGAVVINRVNSTSFPNTISEVIYQSGQFSPASSGALARALANGVPSTCYEAAAAAIAGEDPTGGALYFNTTANRGIQIGDHWFY